MAHQHAKIVLWPRSRAVGVFIDVVYVVPMWLAASSVVSRSPDEVGSWVGGLFLLACGALGRIRGEIAVFPGRGTVEETWSVVVPLHRAVHQRASFTHVLADGVEELSGGEFSTGTQINCRVQLVGSGTPLQIDTFARAEEALREAQRVGAIVGLPVEIKSAIEPYDWGPPKSATFTVRLGAALAGIGLAIVAWMIWLGDWTALLATPFAAFFVVFGALFLYMGIARKRQESRARQDVKLT